MGCKKGAWHERNLHVRGRHLLGVSGIVNKAHGHVSGVFPLAHEAVMQPVGMTGVHGVLHHDVPICHLVAVVDSTAPKLHTHSDGLTNVTIVTTAILTIMTLIITIHIVAIVIVIMKTTTTITVEKHFQFVMS